MAVLIAVVSTVTVELGDGLLSVMTGREDGLLLVGVEIDDEAAGGIIDDGWLRGNGLR